MRLLRRLLRLSLCLVLGAALGGILLYFYQVLSGPPLQPWHRWQSPAEYHAAAGRIGNLDDYRRLEERLFSQLATLGASLRPPASSRYAGGNPLTAPVDGNDWNRTVELRPDGEPRGAVLLLHGMSDAPYSLRALALDYRARGFHVLALRLPGHGTVPAGLLRVTWEEMATVVRLAVNSLRPSLTRGRPLFITGYSNGAALALHYTLAALQQEELPRPAGLVLISPAIAVTPAARYSRLLLWAGALPGLEQLAWLSLQPEYDPYKYNSFPVNAGYQVFLLSRAVQEGLRALESRGAMADFPPVLAIQSVVDDTVTAGAVIDRLMSHLRSGRDELVLFDINRDAAIIDLFAGTRLQPIQSLLEGPAGFRRTLLTNRYPDRPEVWALEWTAGSNRSGSRVLGLEWPRGIYSLSHVALPIPPDDPVYGIGSDDRPSLGRIELRGEQRLLQVPGSQLMRLRYNPFHDYMKGRIAAFVERLAEGG
ncbi:MAG TPA: alpha/beta hydrolase [Sedimenticola thiotaurini]|uniref:Alpha/beta hydrolase n=1 Tax=Sedimenticola thiotaurini TaxID=1543721 RepID=A0A831RHJ8_9GAMM|nr:alpha/beta hydrolase [Sedimenticola thiotaurini]